MALFTHERKYRVIVQGPLLCPWGSWELMSLLKGQDRREALNLFLSAIPLEQRFKLITDMQLQHQKWDINHNVIDILNNILLFFLSNFFSTLISYLVSWNVFENI